MPVSWRLTVLELVLIVLGLASGLGFLAFRPELPMPIRVFLKILPLALMAVWMLSRRVDRHNGAIFVGLLFALAGDVAMEFSDPTITLVGIVLNMLALVAYTVYFVQSDPSLDLWRVLPFLVVIGGLYLVLVPTLGAFRIPVGVYCLLYVLFLWRSSARLGDPTITVASQWVCFVGCLIITASDALLGMAMFQSPVPAWDSYYLSMALWWTGQLMMTVTAEIREKVLRQRRAAAS